MRNTRSWVAFDLIEQALFLGGSAFANGLRHICSPLERVFDIFRDESLAK